MAENFKYPTRTLSTENTGYTNVVWQPGKPPLDSELNLMGQIANNNLANLVKSTTYSGALINPLTCDKDYIFESTWSNMFKVKAFKAIVNGEVVSVEEATIKLPPPPPSGTRADFVFLEVWKTIVSAQGSGASLDNKPTNSTIYRNGNVEGAGLDDELVDAQIGFETTKRVQIQYQYRVVSEIDFKTNPEGLSSSLVKAIGPTDGLDQASFSNVDGDVGLWKADVVNNLLADDAIYAIPMCLVFRRNSAPYVAVSLSGAPNQNGAVNRKPSSTVIGDATPLSIASLSSSLDHSTIGEVTLVNLLGSGLEDSDLFVGGSRFFTLNNEVIKVSSVDLLNNKITIEERGVAGTNAKYHTAGTICTLFTGHPKGYYSDQIVSHDVLDMRHAVTLGEWDYHSLLEGALGDLLTNRLHTTYKQNSVNAYCKGPVIQEVSHLSATPANRTHQMDYPNGFRDTWSDAATPQFNLSLYLSPSVATDARGLSIVNLNVDSAPFWEIGPDLNPRGFFYSDVSLKMGSIIWLSIDDVLDNLGYGLRGNSLIEKGLRFISPRECADWNQEKAPPFSIEQLGAEQGFFSYPRVADNFETPFIVLGRSLLSENFTTSITDPSTDNHNIFTLYKKNASNSGVASATSQNTPNQYEEIVVVELSSELPIEVYRARGANTLYATIYGDPSAGTKNNGVFKVIDLQDYESENYFSDNLGTDWTPASRRNLVFLQAIDFIGARTGNLTDSLDLTIEFRSSSISELDTEIAIAITEAVDGLPLHTNSDFVLNVAVMYPPNSPATPNVPDIIDSVGVFYPNRDNVLKNASSDLDPANTSLIPLINGEVSYGNPTHVSQWSRLPSSNRPTGWSNATSLGGQIINEEIDREAEVFKDEGSKTLVIRPFQKKQVILHQHQESSAVIPTSYNAGHSVDGGALWLADKRGVYKLPEALMPRFGRQDIPLHTRTSTSDSFLSGLNHILVDVVSTSDNIFNVIGGVTNGGNPRVEPILFDTTSTYGEYALSLSGTNAIGAKKRFNEGDSVDRTDSISAPTSDFGLTLQGIELPPYYGVARVYGVYERSAYITHVIGNGHPSGHNTERTTPLEVVSNGSCPNLLRSDTSSFTLYINQNGGNPYVSQSGFTEAHTYVLTEHALDVTRIPTYVEGQTFGDFDYVVEAVVFGFSDGFISSNRNVLARAYNGSGVARASNETSVLRIDSVIPFAPPAGSRISVSYQRTPYQGDPYATKGVSIQDDTDFTLSTGRKSVTDLILGTRDQSSVEVHRPRPFQVLASMDFYTTLGTGKVGGSVYPTTLTDVGYSYYPSGREGSSLSYYPTISSAFTQTPQKGGFATIHFFNSVTTVYSDVILRVQSSRGTELITLGANGETTLEEVVTSLQRSLDFLGYKTTQIKGVNSLDLGVVIQEPFNTDNSSIAVFNLPTYKTGRDIQVFEGIRERPLSFDFYDTLISTSNEELFGLTSTTGGIAYFSKPSVTTPSNAGDGYTPFSLAGMTSRLPLGSKVRDTDFLCEDFLNNKASFLGSKTGGFSALNSSVPVSSNGIPYSRAFGTAGNIIEMSSGDITQVSPLAESSNLFSLSRGTGAIFNVGGEVEGAPFNFSSFHFSEATLKGSVLAGKAMLVRNAPEDFEGNPLSYGDELQLVVVTHCIDAQQRTPIGTLEGGLLLGGEISPTGYGEGFAAADRYRIKGRPLSRGFNDITPSNATLAPFNRG
jgi:hypothetical protein